MIRQPRCYPISEDTWMCNLYRHSGNSIGITVPKGIVEAQRLRPGMVVSVTITKQAARPEPAEDQEEGQ